MEIQAFQEHLLQWHQSNMRDMPWRKTQDPYEILVSEIMLQQTQISRVIPKYKEFLQAFPTVKILARATDHKLLAVWSGLGYWRRAKFLKETAHKVVKNFDGKFPQDIQTLQTLPGIGPYTAGALTCFAFGSDEPFIDTNIRRVYLHFFFKDKKNVADTQILKIAKKAVWKKDPREWHYALFDYGSTVLKNKKINTQSKHYAKQSAFEGSFRSFRTRVVKKLLASPNKKLSQALVLDFLEDELRKEERDYSPEEIIDALLADNLIKKTKHHFSL